MKERRRNDGKRRRVERSKLIKATERRHRSSAIDLCAFSLPTARDFTVPLSLPLLSRLAIPHSSYCHLPLPTALHSTLPLSLPLSSHDWLSHTPSTVIPFSQKFALPCCPCPSPCGLLSHNPLTVFASFPIAHDPTLFSLFLALFLWLTTANFSHCS